MKVALANSDLVKPYFTICLSDFLYVLKHLLS